ncbi:hypothetical protein HY492_03105 [Candidatus Woesearchaeota archaeon]|nr:hypothetical protein [Candidatus Woesearchaeota archaeon]
MSILMAFSNLFHRDERQRVLGELRNDATLQAKIQHAFQFTVTYPLLIKNILVAKKLYDDKVETVLYHRGFSVGQSAEAIAESYGSAFFAARNALNDLLYALTPEGTMPKDKKPFSDLMAMLTTNFKTHFMRELESLCEEIVKARRGTEIRRKGQESKHNSKALYGELLLSLEEEFLNLSDLSTAIYRVELRQLQR